MAEHRSTPKRRGLTWAFGLSLVTFAGMTLLRRRPSDRPAAGGAATASGRGRPLGQPSAVAVTHGYETVDTNVRALVIIIVVALGLIVGGLAGVFAMYGSFARQDRAGATVMTAEQKAAIVPPEPHLQAEPNRDLGVSLMQQTQQLNTYGWSDSEHTRPHIPIERAMALVVGAPLDGQHLPTAPSGAASGGVTR